MTTGSGPQERAQGAHQALAPRVRRAFVVFGLFVAALLALALPQALGIRADVDDLRTRWAPAASAASSLTTALADRQSAALAYATTGEPAMLDDYRTLASAVAASFRDLRRLGLDRPGRAMLARVQRDYDRWLTSVATPAIALAAGGRVADATARVTDGGSEQFARRVRAAQAALVRHATQRARDLSAVIHRADQRLVAELLIALGAVLAILLVARTVFGRWAARLDRQREVELRLAEQTELLLRVTNTTPDPIFLKDDVGRYVFLNDGTAHALGGESADAIRGRRDAELFEGDELPTVRRDDDLVRASDAPLVFEERVGGRLYEVTKTAFPFADGRRGVLGVGHDMTIRARERERLAAVAMVTRAVAIHESVDEVGAAVRDVFAAVSGADVIWVLVADPERRSLRAVLKDGTHAGTGRDWEHLPATPRRSPRRPSAPVSHGSSTCRTSNPSRRRTACSPRRRSRPWRTSRSPGARAPAAW